MAIFKKKKVPDELPDLATDSIEEKLKEKKPKEENISEIKIKEEEIKPEIKKEIKEEPKIEVKKEVVEETKPEIKKEIIKELPEEKIIERKKEFRPEMDFKTYQKPRLQELSLLEESKHYIEEQEKGFFTEVEQYLSNEVKDLSQLENWYQNKFVSRDPISEMKTYWEKQKKASVMNSLGKTFQEKIAEKTTKLQILEKEWQTVYFELIEKEEAIRENERELKKMLSEFVELCKNRDKDKEAVIEKEGRNYSIERDENDDKIIRLR